MSLIAGVFLSAVPVGPGFVFANIHMGPGSGSKHDEGLGVGYEHTSGVSLAGGPYPGPIWRLRYRLFNPIPAGTPKIVLVGLLNEASKVAKVNVQWGLAPIGSDPSNVTLNDEGTTTITWGANDANKYVESKITLDAAALQNNSIILIDLIFINSGWTVTKTITFLLPQLIVE